MTNAVHCRFCGTPLEHTFVDLGMSPLSNAYVSEHDLVAMEPFFPLHVRVCHKCFLVQLPMVQTPDNIFGTEYAYFSSYSDAWLEHARQYTEKMIRKFGLDRACRVVEIASNDGYLLQHFNAQGIPVLGVEPAANVAQAAVEKGIPTIVKFFGHETANELMTEGYTADLLVGNNVLAHVPDINDFVAGMKVLLKERGVITVEFPHLLQLMAHNQFDTIYHEHYSYLSFAAVRRVFAAHGLVVFDVEELWTHGGSLRVYARHEEDEARPVSESVADLLRREEVSGLEDLETYARFGERVHEVKRNVLSFLIEANRSGKKVVGYGAPAKGNTLLNYCGIRTDFLAFTVDRSPHKQNRYLPGTHIPIRAPEAIRAFRPDYVLILPWNIREEIMTQISYIREWGGKFAVPIPTLKVYS